MSRVYPTVEDAIATHDLLIEEYGGSFGIRDRGALASAIFRLPFISRTYAPGWEK